MAKNTLENEVGRLFSRRNFLIYGTLAASAAIGFGVSQWSGRNNDETNLSSKMDYKDGSVNGNGNGYVGDSGDSALSLDDYMFTQEDWVNAVIKKDRKSMKILHDKAELIYDNIDQVIDLLPENARNEFLNGYGNKDTSGDDYVRVGFLTGKLDWNEVFNDRVRNHYGIKIDLNLNPSKSDYFVAWLDINAANNCLDELIKN